MYTKIAAVAALAGVVAAAPQAVTGNIAPKEDIPAGCSLNYDGKFEIAVVNVTSNKAKREESTPLVSSLENGVLTDAQGRTGYIASNNQFQYDGPPQAGAIFTSGFSVCQNGSLALGNSAIFYKCLSGAFYNLYDDNDEAQCSPVFIQVLPVGSGPSTAAANQIPDGQVTASPVSNVACQIKDGQIQDNTCTGMVPVTQIADGQIQAGTRAAPVTQIGDGQIQAPTGAPVTQIGDGQIQAPAGAPVTQIADGQIQAPTGAVVTQIADGQIQAPNGSVKAAPTPAPFTGSATALSAGVFGVVAGLLAVIAL